MAAGCDHRRGHTPTTHISAVGYIEPRHHHFSGLRHWVRIGGEKVLGSIIKDFVKYVIYPCFHAPAIATNAMSVSRATIITARGLPSASARITSWDFTYLHATHPCLSATVLLCWPWPVSLDEIAHKCRFVILWITYWEKITWSAFIIGFPPRLREGRVQEGRSWR